MFAAERKRIIKKYLEENTKVSVAKLSNLLEVSEVTIRKDLESLEDEGFLQRTHGGAILSEAHRENEALIEKIDDTEVYNQQIEIASSAYHFVTDGETIMLTDGPTNRQIAKKLVSRNNLTILTNDILIASEFSKSLSNHLILLGGTLFENALFGQLTLSNLANFYINHIFIEVEGITLENGISVSSIDKASMIGQAWEKAKTSTVICLPDNFGLDSFFKVGELDYPRKILTCSELNSKYKKALFEKDIKLYTSLDLYEE